MGQRLLPGHPVHNLNLNPNQQRSRQLHHLDLSLQRSRLQLLLVNRRKRSLKHRPQDLPLLQNLSLNLETQILPQNLLHSGQNPNQLLSPNRGPDRCQKCLAQLLLTRQVIHSLLPHLFTAAAFTMQGVLLLSIVEW